MNIMFFDTETGGKYANEFDLLQLSYQIVSYPGFDVIKQQNFYFRREREASSEAIAINGLTDAFLYEQDLTERHVAMNEFLTDLSKCRLLVAHCLRFDTEFIYYACKETHNLPQYKQVLENMETYDTMLGTTSLCCLPFTSSRYYQNESEYKYPKLSELADFLNINKDDIKLHDSNSDVELTVRCFKKLVEMGWVILKS